MSKSSEPTAICAPFLVLGVPRSGTTLFARLLNNYPSILCGSERFYGHLLSHAHLTLTGYETLDVEHPNAARHFEMLALKKDTPDLVIGEKLPRAYMHWDKTLPRFRDAGTRLKMVVLIRDVDEIENS